MDVPRGVSRDPSPLKHRRVRHKDGREGTIDRTASGRYAFIAPGHEPEASASVHFDGEMTTGSYPHPKLSMVNAVDLTLLDAPAIAAPVYVRRVLFRGHKEQVSERWAALAPLTPEQVEGGERRYVEFDPQPAAYRRWRIVYMGPPMGPEKVAAAPDQNPRAETHRRDARDAAHDY